MLTRSNVRCTVSGGNMAQIAGNVYGARVRVPGLCSRWPRAASSAHPFPGGHPDCRPGFVCATGRTRGAASHTTRTPALAGEHRAMHTMMLTAYGPWHDHAPAWWPVFPIGFGLFWL